MKVKDVFMYVLGAIVVLSFIAITILLIVNPTLRDSLHLVIGAWLTAFGTVVGYFFGSSKGSAEKNDLLSNAKKG